MDTPATAPQQTLSLLDVGDDVIMVILDELQETSPHSVVSLGLVHPLFNKLAQQYRYRELVFDHSSVACAQLNLINDSHLLSTIRSLSVTGDAEDDEQNHSWRLLADLVPEMTALKDVAIITSREIPAAIIHAIQNCRKARLHITFSTGVASGECLALQRLTGVANLHSLDLKATYIQPDSCLRVTKPLRDILLSCQNLRVLKLDLNEPQRGCVRYGPKKEYMGCGFHNGERPLAALEVLHLEHYPFGQLPPTDTEDAGGVNWSWDGYPGSEPEEDYWAATFDWTRLRVLRSSSPWYFSKFMPYLTALKEFQATSYWGVDSEDALSTFLAEVPSKLERIRAHDFESIGVDSLRRHSSHLKALHLHTPFLHQNGKWRERAMTADSLRLIRDHCEHLEELEIDLARDGEWPFEVLDVLASFPRLKTLSLWLELGQGWTSDSSTQGLVKPFATFASCSSLFKYLRDGSPAASKPSRLRELRVSTGTYHWEGPRGYGKPSPGAFWTKYNSSKFTCALSERDDEASEGVYVTTCPELSEKLNTAMQLALKQDKNPDEYLPGLKDASSSNHRSRRLFERLLVAWNGPTPRETWDSHY
ncbi:hypothetical protein QBC35DRAFT_146714 [Podospora australis]|uniref:F-box domain-containing protein n=1 Tax=Podospora australis TaxID=1536484 RepID=A0AAN6WIU9_9PEZI|nr:hypothetical protein QBC35DRAFT_146714 [Podospora australis]